MNKYIPADKLIAYLKKTMESYKSQMVDPTKYPIDHIDLMAFLAREYQAIIADVEYLQQEQPELPGYNKALLEVKSKVDELYEATSIGLSEYDSGLYNGIADTCMKLRGFIKARLDSDEQSESELEKSARYVYESWMGGTMDDVRRDMVELGKVLNARKGDTK